MLTIQVLKHDNSVLETIETEQGELKPIPYRDVVIQQARNILVAPGFAGKNVRVMSNGNILVWQTYYGLIK